MADAKTVKTVKTEKKSASSDLKIYSLDGAEKKGAALPKGIFAKEADASIISQAVRVYLANQRTGNASTKGRSEVIGSTRKIYRQKGTGKARHGDIKAPIFVGGGVYGGPKPRDFSLNISKSQKQQAFFGALTLKAKEKKIIGLSEEGTDKKMKTKAVAGFLKKMNLENKKTLFVLASPLSVNFVTAMRNIDKAEYAEVTRLNVFEVLSADTIVFLESAVGQLEKHFLKD